MNYLPCSLALGGGGPRCAAHIGVLQVIEEEAFPIEFISGSSSGALIGALYALGYDAKKLREIMVDSLHQLPVDLDIKFLGVAKLVLKSAINQLNFAHLPIKDGLIGGKKLDEYLRGLFRDGSFENLRYPLLVTAVDLLSGRLQVFTSKEMAAKLKGVHDFDIRTGVDLLTAVRASFAVPGVFMPVQHGDMVLVDGGLRNLVPADLLRIAGARRVVAVNLSTCNPEKAGVNDLLAILLRTLDIMGSEAVDLVLERYADFVIEPEIDGYTWNDFEKSEQIYQLGYQTTRKKLSALKMLLRERGGK